MASVIVTGRVRRQRLRARVRGQRSRARGSASVLCIHLRASLPPSTLPLHLPHSPTDQQPSTTPGLGSHRKSMTVTSTGIQQVVTVDRKWPFPLSRSRDQCCFVLNLMLRRTQTVKVNCLRKIHSRSFEVKSNGNLMPLSLLESSIKYFFEQRISKLLKPSSLRNVKGMLGNLKQGSLRLIKCPPEHLIWRKKE